MPSKPLRPCRQPGCISLTRTGYCDNHKATRAPDRRPSAHARGYTSRWDRERQEFLAEHPWCAEHQRQKLPATPATEVDHIIPHRGDPALFWDRRNWQGLCKSCHSAKTAREDGGFGNHPPPPKG